MSIATIGAFAIGEFSEAVAVMIFYQVGELLQDYAVDKSKASIKSLLNIRPDYANVKRNNEIIKVNPEEVNIEEIIIVKPGERIPLDGIIIDGKSMIDTSALTGESVPKSVKAQDEVLSGCINKNGLLEVKVTKKFKESTVNKMLELVQNASDKKAQTENFITKFAKIYTPVVVLIAFIIATIPSIFFGNFAQWLYRALSFLVVSCPCALVISIPLGFFAGIGRSAKAGVLIKGGNYLEALSKINTLVFDKTGTLTKGVFEVQSINPINISKDELIKLVAHAESYSTHPIANSIKKAYAKQINNSIISNVQEIAGLGIEAIVEEKNILVGNEKLMLQKNINYIKSKEVGTVLYVAINKEFAGTILISDEIKENTKTVLNSLKQHYIAKTVMLTGDKKEIAEDVAKKLEIDEVYSELLPDKKVKKVEELLNNKNKNKTLAFVGDGINDSPALAVSDVGIAMGALGSDAAIEAADIVIMTDELSKIETAIKISKKTMKIVKENIIFSIVVKIAILILTAIGFSNMWQAVFADVGVSILAVLNVVLRKEYI